MTVDDLRDWQTRMGYTYDTASEALGMSRSGYGNLLSRKAPITLRMELACFALEHCQHMHNLPVKSRAVRPHKPEKDTNGYPPIPPAHRAWVFSVGQEQDRELL
jgi:hypothetical protein